MKITTVDMHTGGEPLRIIKSGYPELKGSTILEKIKYAKQNFDDYRKFLLNEPRGHYDMYGAIVIKSNKKNEIGAIFLNNDGYSPMCGHAVIALGRYAVDYGLVEPVEPETEIIIQCPCGPVKTFVEYINGKSGRVRFESVPAFLYRSGEKIDVEGYGKVEVDVTFGGGFYAFIQASQLKMDLDTTDLSSLVNAATSITNTVKKEIHLSHPETNDLAYYYGTIITDGKDRFEDGPSKNLCVFADKQVDRSPTGSGVTARVALQWSKGLIPFNQEKQFRSITGSSFTGKVIRETSYGDYEKAVIVEVAGKAHYTGTHEFYLEDDDPFGCGFQISR